MLKKHFILCFLLLNAVNSLAQELALIPRPLEYQFTKGHFNLNKNTSLSRITDPRIPHGLVQSLMDQLNNSTKFRISKKNHHNNTISMVLNKDHNPRLGKEGYQLNIQPAKITMQANDPAGLFYAVQSLCQMINTSGIQLPCLQITDYPAFQWRGLMVDLSRHFFDKEVIKRYISQMAKYKFNTLHLHLTDNQGWRIEIQSWPKLNSIGSWRVPRTGYWKNQKAPEVGESATYGGFYSQEDILDIIQHAQKHFIDIVPEVDIPGHSLAMIASYPELSCTKTPQQVLAGDPWNASRTNVLCAGNDSVFVALDHIITEIAEMFPSKYIHIGGDEVSRMYWDKCPRCQKRIKEEHLQSSEELQSYFIKRVAKIVISKGKTPIGWYENLPGGLADSMAFMSWKDNKGGINASREGHQVVMTPAAYTYLDFYQGDPYLENAPFTVNRLSTTFEFNPLPAGIDPKQVLGGQGSLWTEQVPNERKLQFMTWPRAFALSEILWSGNNQCGWENFIRRLEKQLPVLDQEGTKYSRYFYDAMIYGSRNPQNELLISLKTEVKDLDIHYAFDDSDPDQFYPKYTGQPLSIPKGAQSIRVVTYRGNQAIGRVIKLPITELEKRSPLIK
nr:family 20 glycosylhydrolase [Pedobacter sp. ASV19]